MDLKTFVKETLVEIVAGVQEAQSVTRKYGAIVNPGLRAGITNKCEDISFDVAVTVSSEKSSELGGGLKVASMIEGGGKRQSHSTDSSVSRVQFKVIVQLPQA